MGEQTAISWCDHTFNPWIGCTKVSAACDHCYAEALATRYAWVEWGAGKPRHRTSANNWRQPLKWDRQAAADGVRRRVFCASLADVFDTEVPAEWRADLFALIEATPHLDWLLLTKRPKVMAEWFARHAMLPNIWAGTTVESNAMADARLPYLRLVPAVVRFTSCEPLLEHPTWTPDQIQWVICGGESGPNARAMQLVWARYLRNRCAERGIPFFFKQWGGRTPKAGGKILDGREWCDFPVAA